MDRSENQIQDELKATRAALTGTVEELANYLSPKENVKRAKAEALGKVQGFAEAAQDTVEQAKGGDADATKKVALVGGGLLVVGALVLRRIFK